jgi:hypothetical protein
VKKHSGRGRCTLEVWPNLCIATIIKHTKEKRVVEITRKVTMGTCEKAKELLNLTQGCMEFNTAFIERLNGTFRERLVSLTRKCRHAAVHVATLEEGMYLIGCTYNFCFPHQELSKKTHFGRPTTPAMAAALTDHIWSIQEVLWYKVVPTPFVQSSAAKPKRPGRPRKAATVEQTQPKRSRGRPPKYVLAEILATARTAGSFTN